VLWGTTGASQALLDGAFPPLVVGALRAVLGGVVLLAVALPGARRGLAPLRAASTTLLLAGVCVIAYQFSFFTGVNVLGIAVGTILAVGSAPFFAGAASVLLGRHRPSRRWVGTTVLAVAGLVLLLRPDGGVAPSVLGVLADGRAHWPRSEERRVGKEC